MIFIVAGEGPTDIGICLADVTECRGSNFKVGPMAQIIDKLIYPIVGYSLIELESMEFASKHRLNSVDLPHSFLVGKRREYETGLHFKNARALARIAKAKQEEIPDCPIGAVLFHDADGTRSTERGLYEAKWKSIEDGFKAEEFLNGIPMVPKPKSEAWLLCAFKSQPYQGCGALEESLSGNDNSPNPAKAQLQILLAEKKVELEDLTALVANQAIDPQRIDMPSYNRFKARLEEVVNEMLRKKR